VSGLGHPAVYPVVQYLVEKKTSVLMMAFVVLAYTDKALPDLGLNETTDYGTFSAFLK